MTLDFCKKFYQECSAPDQLDLDEGYCDVHATQTAEGEDQYWSHPLELEGEHRLGRPTHSTLHFNDVALTL